MATEENSAAIVDESKEHIWRPDDPVGGGQETDNEFFDRLRQTREQKPAPSPSRIEQLPSDQSASIQTQPQDQQPTDLSSAFLQTAESKNPIDNRYQGVEPGAAPVENQAPAPTPQPEVQQQPEVQRPAPTPPPASERFSQMQQMFQEEMGIDVQSAVQNMNALNEQVTNIQSLANDIALRQQEIDLSLQWGLPSSKVRERVSQLVPYYSQLSDEARTQLHQQGAEGIARLYDLAFQQPQQSQQQAAPVTQASNVPSGNATIANNPNVQEARNLSEVIAIADDDEFFRQLGKRNFNNDLRLNL